MDTKLRLKPEIWEIQIILYLILAQLVETEWIMWVIRIYALISFIATLGLIVKMRKEEADLSKDLTEK